MKTSIPYYLKKATFNHKGFSLLEIMVSAATMAFLAVVFQSVLVTANSFNISQKNYKDVHRVNKFVQNSLCFSSETFKPHLGIDTSKIYKMKIQSVTVGGTLTKKRKYSIPDFEGADDIPLIGLKVNNVQSVSGHLNQGSADETLIKGAVHPPDTKGICFDGEGVPNRFLPVLQDSHTLIKLNVNTSSTSSSGLVESGYVVASRCVENKKTSLYKEPSSDFYRATFDIVQEKATAVYILNLPYRPFYFPNKDTGDDYHDKVQCCMAGSTPTGCQKVASGTSGDTTYVPRIYYIYFDATPFEPDATTYPDGHQCLTSTGAKFSETVAGKKSPRYFGEIVSVSELPELQESHLNWGAGFIFTTEGRKHAMNNILYTLDTLFIKNRCATSPGFASQCPTLRFGENPGAVTFEGLSGDKLKTKDFLEYEVSGCFNQGSGIKHGKAIRF